MKILAIVDLVRGTTVDTVRAHLEVELRAAWTLYSSGSIREIYASDNAARVVFVLESDDAKAAEQQLQQLPLIAAGRFRVEFIELHPFVNWSRLFVT